METLTQALRATSRRWAISGVAGFIGSNLAAFLLEHDQEVVGLDNLSTGRKSNLDDLKREVGDTKFKKFTWIEGDIRVPTDCVKLCAGADIVLHQAALGSVPRSLADPQATHASNVTGFINMLVAARDAGVKRLVYASSSSVYGDERQLPQREDRVGNPLSPYAATKKMNEIYAAVFSRSYPISTIGLRYFNVFGPRQDPNGPYSAVIPRWIDALRSGKTVQIFGDGSTSRDFCYIKNVIQMNLRASLYEGSDLDGQVFNTAVSGTTSLNQLFELIRAELAAQTKKPLELKPEYLPFRPGDIKHSQADLTRAKESLGYAPTHSISDGMKETIAWYVRS